MSRPQDGKPCTPPHRASSPRKNAPNSRARLAGTPENRGVTRTRRERRRRVLKPGISPTDRNRREAAALHAVEAGARRERSWLHVSDSASEGAGGVVAALLLAAVRRPASASSPNSAATNSEARAPFPRAFRDCRRGREDARATTKAGLDHGRAGETAAGGRTQQPPAEAGACLKSGVPGWDHPVWVMTSHPSRAEACSYVTTTLSRRRLRWPPRP